MEPAIQERNIFILKHRQGSEEKFKENWRSKILKAITFERILLCIWSLKCILTV